MTGYYDAPTNEQSLYNLQYIIYNFYGIKALKVLHAQRNSIEVDLK